MARIRRSAVAFVIGLVAMTGAPAWAGPEEDLAAAQRRANRAAEELARAEVEMAQTGDTVAHLQTRVARVESRVAQVRDRVRQLAIRLYVEGTAPVARLLRMGDAEQLVRTQQFSHVVAGTSTDALRQYRVDREDLEQELTVLERAQRSQTAAVETLRDSRAEVIREIDRLSRVVEQARAAARAEQARAEAAAAASANQPGAPRPPSGAAQGEGQGQSQPAVSTPTTLRTTARPAEVAAAAPSSVASGDWICPVQGPRTFSNDYGAPRGGGSSHMGNDILAPKGTPVVANVSGVVTPRNGAVSGLAYFLAGDDGNQYFGAHLDSFGASGRVSAGTVIGTVGNTGDASGGPPHLHFEIHPGGSGYTNPYPTLVRYC